MTRLFSGTPLDITPRCDDCGELESDCTCDPKQKLEAEQRRRRDSLRVPPSEQTASVAVQKRKGNRKVTIVSGLPTEANDLAKLLSDLQAACGAGGTVKTKTSTIELQGDHVPRVRETLAAIGYRLD